ncbi:MAG: lipid IV(A) 3-deoxy-D-manno-octulosonic acid transferase [Xanthomonadales bacterium]
MRRFYTVLLYLVLPLVLLFLLLRSLRNPGYRARWGERFGRFAAPRRTGGIAVHAASVGEVNAASALIGALARQYPNEPLTVTTFTPTGSERVRAGFGDAAFHVYAPLDLPGAVRRFLDRVRPRLLVVMETEIWPNLYAEAAARGIPILIANARISQRSFGRYRRLQGLTAEALGNTARIVAQSAGDAARLRALGAADERLTVTGNLKFDVNLPPGLVEEAEAIRVAWGAQRPVLVAGSTHEREEAALLDAFRGVLTSFPDALLVLVPRHPERFARAAQSARNAGLNVALRSSGAACPADVQCFLVDAMGELLRYYAVGDVAFVGGSLEPVGGHNVLEPAALGRPVLVGPHTFNFSDITAQLIEAGAARQVADGAALQAAVVALFADADERDRMGSAARRLVASGQGALARTLDEIERLLTAAAD